MLSLRHPMPDETPLSPSEVQHGITHHLIREKWTNTDTDARSESGSGEELTSLPDGSKESSETSQRPEVAVLRLSSGVTFAINGRRAIVVKQEIGVKPRKHQKDPHAALRLLGMARQTDAAVAAECSLRVYAAFEALRDGRGDDDDFHQLAGALNVSLIRAEAIAPELVDLVKAGQEAAMSCLRRHEAGKRYGFDAAGLRDIPPALEVYDAVLAESTPLQMTQALQEAARRMRQGETL